MENYEKRLDEAMQNDHDIAEHIETMERQYSELKERMLADEDFKRLALKFSSMANGIEKALVKKLYETHKDDGNMFPIIMGFMSEMLPMGLFWTSGRVGSGTMKDEGAMPKVH